MKIVLVIPGGIDKSLKIHMIPHIRWFVEELSKDHQVKVISFYQYSEACSYKVLGADIHDLGKLKEKDPGNRNPSIAINNRLCKCREILDEFGTADIIHGFWGLEAGWVAVTLANELNIPSVVSLLGAELVSFPDIDYGAQRFEHRRNIVAETVKKASALTVASQHMKNIAEGFDLDVELIPFGVPESCFQSSLATDIPPWNLLHVGSLNKIKDQKTLIHALSVVKQKIKDVHLDLIGQDVLNGQLQKLCLDLDLVDNVRFHGYIPNDEIRQYFQNANIYLVSSINETGPIAMLEAAACKVPTVGTRVGYVSDWQSEGAVAVDIGDFQSMAEHIVQLINDHKKRKAIGQQSYSWVRKHDAGWTNNTFISLYNRLVA